MQVCQQLFYRGTFVVLEKRLSNVYRDDSVSYETFPTVLEVLGPNHRSARPRVTTAADDRYIVLRNRRLNAAATGRQYGIHPQTVKNRLRQNVQPICAY